MANRRSGDAAEDEYDLMELPPEPQAGQQRSSYLPADLDSRLWPSR